jgi:hypothetical protein
VRSDGSREFVNSPQRIRPSVPSLMISVNDQVFLQNLSTCTQTYDAFLKLQVTTSLRCPSTVSKALSFLSFYNSESFQKRLLHALLAATFKHFQVLNPFDSAHTCSSSLSISSLRFTTLRLHLACALLARLHLRFVFPAGIFNCMVLPLDQILQVLLSPGLLVHSLVHVGCGA